MIDTLSFVETRDVEKMRDQLRSWMAQQLGKSPAKLADDSDFSQLGLDSIQALEASDRLSQVIKKPIKASYFFEYPTVD